MNNNRKAQVAETSLSENILVFPAVASRELKRKQERCDVEEELVNRVQLRNDERTSTETSG